MAVFDWSGWGWPGWSALVAVGTLALAGVTVWVTLGERRRIAEQRRYERLVDAAVNVRVAASVIGLVRVALIIEEDRPLVALAEHRSAWLPGTMELMELGSVISRANGSVRLVYALLSSEAKAAANDCSACPCARGRGAASGRPLDTLNPSRSREQDGYQ
jgi:hypothetical protein